MEVITILFVMLLFAAGLLLTLTVRRDFVTREETQRDLQHKTRHPTPRRTNRA